MVVAEPVLGILAGEAWNIQSDVAVPVIRFCCAIEEVDTFTYSDVKLASNSDPSSECMGK